MQKENNLDLASQELSDRLDAMKAEWTKENEEDEYPGYADYLKHHVFLTDEDIEMMAELEGEYD